MADLSVTPSSEAPAPTPSDVLTPEQRESATSWIKTHWTNGSCPFHGRTTWQIGPTFVSTVGYRVAGVSGSLSLGAGQAYPSFVVICNLCGYTVFVNALIAGLIPRDPKPATRPEGE